MSHQQSLHKYVSSPPLRVIPLHGQGHNAGCIPWDTTLTCYAPIEADTTEVLYLSDHLDFIREFVKDFALLIVACSV
jgi:hypothetical protein